MDNEEKYKKLIRAIKILREIKPRDESLEKWIKDYVPDLAETDDERIRKSLIHFVKIKGEEFGFIDANTSVEETLAWLEKQRSPKSAPMQNGIIINGVEYELIKDDEADECDRCALKDQCGNNGEDLLCTPIFGYDIMSFHRFEKRK